MNKHDLSDLTWFVEVSCSGGWKVLGAFADEASAWEFGAKHINVRVYRGDELLGVKDGYKQPWRGPTEQELSRDRYLVENTCTGEHYHSKILQSGGWTNSDLFISNLEGAQATVKALNAESSNIWKPKALLPKT